MVKFLNIPCNCYCLWDGMTKWPYGVFGADTLPCLIVRLHMELCYNYICILLPDVGLILYGYIFNNNLY